jgi:hypothetical protein
MVRSGVLAAGVAAIAALGLASTVERGTASDKAPAPIDRAATPTAAMVLGVQAHIGQGWPETSTLRLLRQSGTKAVRDGLGWARGEPARGRYAFDGPQAAALDAICRSGADLLLTVDPRHPLYDGGRTVASGEGQAAYAAYVAALADHFGSCLVAVEVGNEINGERALDYPAAEAPARYVALVRATRAALRPRRGIVAVLGGSTNVIGTGFLDRLFAAGLLDVADGIAVHPYRSHAEGIDVELDRLNDTMRRRGRKLPIWATEFSDNYADPAIAAREMVKTVTMMGAAGVHRAYWYALIDQRWFRNMGLFAAGGASKPAADAFVAIQRLLARERPVRVEGDGLSYLYRFGADTWVLWGAPRPVRFTGNAVKVFDARGRPIPTPSLSGAEPLIVTKATAVRLGDAAVIADSLSGYGTSAWRYLARTPDGTERPLGMLDDRFASARGDRFLRPLRIAEDGAAPGGDAARPVAAIVRYVSPVARRGFVVGCFSKRAAGNGIVVEILAAGKPTWRGVLTERQAPPPIPVTLGSGEAVDVRFSPNGRSGGNALRYRVQFVSDPAAAPRVCP